MSSELEMETWWHYLLWFKDVLHHRLFVRPTTELQGWKQPFVRICFAHLKSPSTFRWKPAIGPNSMKGKQKASCQKQNKNAPVLLQPPAAALPISEGYEGLFRRNWIINCICGSIRAYLHFSNWKMWNCLSAEWEAQLQLYVPHGGVSSCQIKWQGVQHRLLWKGNFLIISGSTQQVDTTCWNGVGWLVCSPLSPLRMETMHHQFLPAATLSKFPTHRWGWWENDFMMLKKYKCCVLVCSHIISFTCCNFGFSFPSQENLVESKHHKLARSLRSGPSDHDLKPNAATRDQLNVSS